MKAAKLPIPGKHERKDESQHEPQHKQSTQPTNTVTSGPSSRKRTRPWTAKEEIVFWSDVVRQYKPDWRYIDETIASVNERQGQERRTEKSTRMKYNSQIRPELLARAGKEDGVKASASGQRESKSSEVKRAKRDSDEGKGM